ncbi:insulinoma-associated protein 2 [Scleropages formosus]|uniref:insulinoma-associated protein 2 n=1 Tax=Scleropages formosus TaxID=113540 RepID=UPI0010FA75F8|nr:insulinoma-associated protein 2 [Scleropages formosus]
MPRGFLVKRIKRASPAFYRTREPESEPRCRVDLSLLVETPSVDVSSQSAEPPDAQVPARPPATVSTTCPDAREGSGSRSRASEPGGAEGAEGRSLRVRPTPVHAGEHEAASPGRADASYSPMKPVGSEQGKSFFERCLSSPAAAESFPTSTPSAERMMMLKHPPFDTPVHLYSPLHQALKRSYLESARKAKSACKKPKATRKLSFEDEVTTSPVLGLQIKKEGPEPKAPSSSRRKPLGEFICQLCKEEYPDPFSLAQHRCSRIVRVEYRCPECDKVFSCPANLASHRRWHKPRPGSHGEPPGGAKKPAPAAGHEPEKRSLEGKENTKVSGGDQHHAAADSDGRAAQRHRAADGGHGPDPRRKKCQEESAAEGPLDTSRMRAGPGLLRCSDTPASAYLPSAPCPPEEVFECRLCDKTFRRQAYLRKHLSSHESARASSYSHIEIESGQITFPCHLCGAHFPSSETRDKHELWHAVREDALLSPGAEGASAFARSEAARAEPQQILACKHCPSTFFSSPGLTRHMSKAHPTESRQVMLLQMAIRPGC